jgi:hypothetical protein
MTEDDKTTRAYDLAQRTRKPHLYRATKGGERVLWWVTAGPANFTRESHKAWEFALNEGVRAA